MPWRPQNSTRFRKSFIQIHISYIINKITKTIVTDNLVLTTELKTYIDHRKKFKGWRFVR